MQYAPRAIRRMRSRGFTLIEVMIVVVIIGILATLIVPKIMDKPDEARAATAKAQIASLMTALRDYKLGNGTYPSSEQGLQALVQLPTTAPIPKAWKKGGYLESTKVPEDPWGHPYQYLNPGLHGEIDVWSLGKDGQPGGDGTDADIGSWM